jgi:hypothetical protein
MMGRISLALMFVLASSCATIQKHPTQPQVESAQVKAARIVDGFTTAITIADEAGVVAGSIASIPARTKNEIDCAVLKAVGRDNPEPAIQAACGAVPSKQYAPFRVAARLLKDLTASPCAGNTVNVALTAAGALWDALERSSNVALASLARILRAALQPTQTACGGVA